MSIFGWIGSLLGKGRKVHDRAIEGIREGFAGRQPMTPQQAGFTPGMPGYDQYLQQLDKLMRGGSPWAQAAQVGQGAYSGDMRNYITGLQNMAAGRGPSLAENQYKAAADQGMRQSAAIAASGRGNVGQAMRQSQKATGQITQGLAQGSATARLQEQMAAQQQLGGALGMADNAEFQRQGLNAQLSQQSNLANQQAWLGMLQQKFGLSEAQAQNLLGYYQALSAQMGAFAGAPTGFDRLMNMFGTLGGLGGK